jgi:hypothetical protein
MEGLRVGNEEVTSDESHDFSRVGVGTKARAAEDCTT